jgi:glycosidase
MPRPVIYQLLPRIFGNKNETRKPNGTLAENGCGKFADIDGAALAALADMGFTHLWLTGVMEQASGTAYPDRPADDPDILKGVAGSPYAIRDYFDVCPDYAVDPGRRIDEFRDLLVRCKGHGLKAIVDLVPNHVARSHDSSVRPDLSFGARDDRSVFFARDNNFFWLQPGHPGGGPPLRLPNADAPGCDGFFPPETERARATGNNVVSWAPSIHDWYETAKLNYGHDFTTGRDTSHLPPPDAPPGAVPDTWRKMDAILAHWQALGVDGFRADMAHMVPIEFWRWAVRRARRRDPAVFFMAEAYDGDPAKLVEGNVLDALLSAGFDAVYDDPSYKTLHGLYSEGKWCNDLDAQFFTGERFHHSVRYAENHDEVRLANPREWGGLGMDVGRPVSAVLFGMGRGPVMVYHGQEVGEPALGAEGFSGDNARTTIFDYWAMPELQKWVNGGRYDGARLSAEQRALRSWYRDLLRLLREPAFAAGEFFGLNHANLGNPAFGRIPGDPASGHWLCAFLRHDPATGQAFLVAANFHGAESMPAPRIRIPAAAREWLGRPNTETWQFRNRLGIDWQGVFPGTDLESPGISLPGIAPCSALMLEIA